MIREARERDEFITPASPPGLKVVQIATDNSRSSENVYMDCNSWTPDSQRFTFWRQPSDDGRQPGGLWLCDTTDNFSIEPIIEYEVRANLHTFPKMRDAFVNACLSPDGTAVYATVRRQDVLEVSRIDLATRQRHVVATAPVPWTIRGQFSISCDSRHLVEGVFLGDGRTEGAPWGLCVFDLQQGTHRFVELGNGFRNLHCQYSKNPAAPTDMLVSGGPGRLSDGSWLTPPDGSWRHQDLPGRFAPGQGPLTTHHVIRDDGTHWRMLPIGNGGDMLSGGHCGFRGTGDTVCAAMYDTRGGKWRAPIVELTPVSWPGGRDHPEYWRGQLAAGVPAPVDLSRKLARADSCHIAGDRSGKYFVSDTDGYVEGKYAFLWVATYVEAPGEPPWLQAKYLLQPRSTYKGQPAHAHPVLSADGRYVAFQSDFSGRPQVNVAYGFDYP
ncbi:MAG: hypothetical protein PCFJNLEI_01388 [Verrucomicrobiae bacterium]|nr:hypothetical protein [Verrucomicrobiae bacterium]